MTALGAIAPPLQERPAETGLSRGERRRELFDVLGRTVWRGRRTGDAYAGCLCALAVRFRPDITARQLAWRLPRHDNAFDLADVQNSLARLGFKSELIRCRIRDLDARLTPCLLTPLQSSDGQFTEPKVIDRGWSATGEPELRLIDGLTGETRRLALDEPEAGETADILVFTPVALSAKASRGGAAGDETSWWLTQIFSRFGPNLRSVMAIGFALNLLAMSAPLFVMLAYDRVLGPQASEPLIFLAVGAFIAIGSEAALRHARSQSLAALTSRMDYLVGTAQFQKLLRMPTGMIEKTGVSSHLARLKSFESVRDFFSGPVLISTLEIPATLLSFLVILSLGGPLVLVVLGAVLVYAAAALFLWRAVSKAIVFAAKENSIAQQFRLETLQKLESIKLDGLTRHWREKNRELSGRATVALESVQSLGAIGEIVGGAIGSATALAMLGVGAQLIWSGQLSMGELIAVTMLTWRAVAPFHSLCSVIPRFEQTRNAIGQIDQFMATDSEEVLAVDLAQPIGLRGGVSFVSTSLRYSAEAGPVFMGLNLEARRGEVVAIAGPDGSGKSSVLKMILGLQPPLTGAVRLDGFDIRQLDLRDLRTNIAYAPQQVALFSGPLSDNLRVSAPIADDEALWDALDQAGARADVEALPGGLDFEIDPASKRGLSRLLVQRIGLARALLRQTSILLIDEQPASALRSGLDDDIRRIVAAARGRRTVFLVTNRADLIRLADRAVGFRIGATPVVGGPDKVLELAS